MKTFAKPLAMRMVLTHKAELHIKHLAVLSNIRLKDPSSPFPIPSNFGKIRLHFISFRESVDFKTRRIAKWLVFPFRSQQQ